MKGATTVLALVTLLLFAGPAGAQTPATWIFTSDIHLNAADDPALVDRLAAAPVAQWDALASADPRPPAPWGADTNLQLFRLALAQMKTIAPDPRVVVLPGDFLAHVYRTKYDAGASDKSDAAFAAFVDKTVAYLAYAFGAAFPHAQFVITLGNNDSACGNYSIAPGGPFYAHMAQAWAPLVNRNGSAPGFVHDFSLYGNYTSTVPGGTELIAVNSNAWSPMATETCDPGNTAAREVMPWFERTVRAAPHGARTWALLHIPPGIDTFASLAGKPGRYQCGSPAEQPNPKALPLYCPDFLARLRNVRAADGAPLGLIIAGHLHNDGFRLVDRTPLLLVPSISVDHANNPSFIVARVDGTTATIADFRAYAYNDAPPHTATAFAPEFDFDTAYKVHGFTADALGAIQAELRDDIAVRTAQAEYWVGGSPNVAFHADDPATWQPYWCANQTIDPDAFLACEATFAPAKATP